MDYQKVCSICYELFDTKSRNALYCKECKEKKKQRKKKKIETRRCKICDKLFLPKFHNQRYCSKECREVTQTTEYLIKKGKGWYKLRFEILKRDDFTCQYCGRKPPGVELQIDHINPRKGTPTERADNSHKNLITACKECNTGKTDVLLSQHMYYKKKSN